MRITIRPTPRPFLTAIFCSHSSCSHRTIVVVTEINCHRSRESHEPAAISTALERTHKLAFHGLGRPALKDPDQESSYGLGSWWANNFLNGRFRFAPGQRLLVPMDSRTTASPTGEDDYVFYPAGGWSWSVLYLAGLYALACQVDRHVTPETFWAAALNTGRIIPLEHEGQKIELGTIADPVALIERLQEGTKAKGHQAAN